MSGRVPDRAHLERVIGTCLHCGLCLPACPTYELTTDERSSPRGRIRLIRSTLDGTLEPGRAFADEMNFCLDCRACETACPAGVRYGELVTYARELSAARKLEPAGVRLRKFVLLRGIFRSGRTFAAFASLMRLYRRSGLREAVERSGILDLLPASLARSVLSLPDVADESFLASAPEVVAARRPRKGTAALLSGCVMNHSFPEVHRQTSELLAEEGYDVVVPRGQFCCGALHAHNGDPAHARRLAAGLLSSFSGNADVVVANSAGCGAFLREYGRVLEDDPSLANRAAAFAGSVRDVTELLTPDPPRQEKAGERAEGRMTSVCVTYHDPCHLAHAQGITREPRALLAAAAGTQYVELPNASRCCGSAGIYNLLRPADSAELLRRKVASILSTGATTVVTGNPGCHLQIARGLREAGSGAEVVHPVSFLHRRRRQLHPPPEGSG